MIGFDVPEKLNDLKKNLLWKHHIFTGEAKPNVIRLLPSLALTIEDADNCIAAIKKEISSLQNSSNIENNDLNSSLKNTHVGVRDI